MLNIEQWMKHYFSTLPYPVRALLLGDQALTSELRGLGWNIKTLQTLEETAELGFEDIDVLFISSTQSVSLKKFIKICQELPRTLCLSTSYSKTHQNLLESAGYVEDSNFDDLTLWIRIGAERLTDSP